MAEQKYISKFTGEEIDNKLEKFEVKPDGSVNINTDVTSTGSDGTVRRMIENPALLPYFTIDVVPTVEEEDAGKMIRTIKQDGFYTFNVKVRDVQVSISFEFDMPVVIDTFNILNFINIWQSVPYTIDNFAWGMAPAYNRKGDTYAGTRRPWLSLRDLKLEQTTTINLLVSNGMVCGFLGEF